METINSAKIRFYKPKWSISLKNTFPLDGKILAEVYKVCYKISVWKESSNIMLVLDVYYEDHWGVIDTWYIAVLIM